MRRLASAALILTSMLTACEFDNYAPPQSTLEGRLVYQGQPVNVRENAIQLEIWQEGYALRSPIPVYVKQDGSFAAKLFDGDYKLVRKQNNGPWQNDADTIRVALRGAQSLDVAVNPYLVIQDAQIQGASGALTASFRIAQVVPGMVPERVALYAATTQFVDARYNGARAERPAAAADIGGAQNLSVQLGGLAGNRGYVFARIGVKTRGVEEMIYTPVQKITLR